MRISKGFIVKLFAGANIQRWNDKIRPAELTELDKHAHKMIIAYIIGKYHEKDPGFDWIKVIEYGIFDMLQRVQITDVKSQIFHEIKNDPDHYQQLNKWVYDQLYPVLNPLGPDFNTRFKAYFTVDPAREEEDINRQILNAAHIYATDWEYDLIDPLNSKDSEKKEIRNTLDRQMEKYAGLNGFEDIQKDQNIKAFIDLCGYLRFQTRWNHIRMITQTSVLGHMLIVAILSYLFSEQAGLGNRRKINNYLTGLFHDFPEVLTKDVVSPVKSATEGIQKLINAYQDGEMERKVFKYIPKDWRSDFELFTHDEFSNSVVENNIRRKVDQISPYYGDDRFNARDGRLVKACDELAAFTEAHLALRHGVNFQALYDAKYKLRDKYNREENRSIVGINFAEILADYDD